MVSASGAAGERSRPGLLKAGAAAKLLIISNQNNSRVFWMLLFTSQPSLTLIN